jgi:tRNA pseudouridine13 synthase
MPRIKSVPEDFLVEELPLYSPSGGGEHTWVEVEKRLRTTEDVAAELAAAAGVDTARVGWAGRKDREAVARQWLSLPGLAPARAEGLAGDGWRVLRAAAHEERLRLGELVGNRFRLVVRDVDDDAASAAAERLAAVAREGLPNYFGEQRFGRDEGNQRGEPKASPDVAERAPGLPGGRGGNPERGAALLRGETVAGGRRQQRLYLSALQSAIFNEVLRTRPAPPHVLLAGDLALVHASGALLLAGSPALPPAAWAERAARFELSPTGPLVGHKMRAPRGEALRRERTAAERWGMPWVTELPRLRGHELFGGRRPLRVSVAEVSHRRLEGDALELAFVLPPGSYATVLVDELFRMPA